MKNKFLNISFIIILMLSFIGLSPPGETLDIGNHVYAENITIANNSSSNTNGTLTVTDDKFGETIDKYLSENGSDNIDKTNITDAFTLMNSNLSKISAGARTAALAMGIVVIAIAGFKFINHSNGSISEFLKSRQDVSNSLIAVVFIVAIPYLAHGVLSIKISSNIFPANSVLMEKDANFSDIVTTPKSGIADYIKSEKKNIKEFPKIDITDGDTKNKSLYDDSGFGGMVIKAVLNILAVVVYTPILLIATFLGTMGFYPVSFDVNMYSSEIYETIIQVLSSTEADSQSFIESIQAGTASFAIKPLASALENLTIVINLLYFIIKKFCILAIECVCYYYGIRTLLGYDTDTVGQFLHRLGEGLIGMLLTPFLIEFMLDIDAIIATSILSITGKTIPGIGMLNLLIPYDTAKGDFTTLFFAIAMGIMLIVISKVFFIRRIEITLYYLASPLYFLKHIIKANAKATVQLINTLSSAIFINTIYAPLFVFVTLLVQVGQATATDTMEKVVYYVLIIALVWLGKPIIDGIIAVFTNPIASKTQMGMKVATSEGLDVKNKAKDIAVGGLAAGMIVKDTMVDTVKGVKKGYDVGRGIVKTKGVSTVLGGVGGVLGGVGGAFSKSANILATSAVTNSREVMNEAREKSLGNKVANQKVAAANERLKGLQMKQNIANNGEKERYGNKEEETKTQFMQKHGSKNGNRLFEEYKKTIEENKIYPGKIEEMRARASDENLGLNSESMSDEDKETGKDLQDKIVELEEDFIVREDAIAAGDYKKTEELTANMKAKERYIEEVMDKMEKTSNASKKLDKMEVSHEELKKNKTAEKEALEKKKIEAQGKLNEKIISIEGELKKEKSKPISEQNATKISDLGLQLRNINQSTEAQEVKNIENQIKEIDNEIRKSDRDLHEARANLNAASANIPTQEDKERLLSTKDIIAKNPNHSSNMRDKKGQPIKVGEIKGMGGYARSRESLVANDEVRANHEIAQKYTMEDSKKVIAEMRKAVNSQEQGVKKLETDLKQTFKDVAGKNNGASPVAADNYDTLRKSLAEDIVKMTNELEKGNITSNLTELQYKIEEKENYLTQVKAEIESKKQNNKTDTIIRDSIKSVEEIEHNALERLKKEGDNLKGIKQKEKVNITTKNVSKYAKNTLRDTKKIKKSFKLEDDDKK